MTTHTTWTDELISDRLRSFVPGQDCTEAFQAALDICAQSPTPTDLQLPVGEYLINSVRSHGVNIRGSQFASNSRNGGRTGTILRQIPGATNHAVVLEGHSCELSGFEIVMNGEATARVKVPIQSPSGRMSFYVSNEDAPTTWDGFQSYCQFFSQGGRHLGWGVVQFVARDNPLGLSRIVLAYGSDMFASPAGVLDESMQVRFTQEVATTWVDGSEIKALSPAGMGFAGVYVAHNASAPGYTQPIAIRNCVIRNGHVGILFGTTVAPWVRDTQISNCHFANVAPLHLNSGADGRFSGLTVQGHYVSDSYPELDDAAGYKDQQYRKSRFGIIPRGLDQVSASLIEHCVEPILVHANNVSLSQLTIEAGYMSAITHTGGTGLMTNMLTVRADPVANHPKSAVILTLGENVTALHGMTSVVSNGDGRYSRFANVPPDSARVILGAIGEMTGVGSVNEPVVTFPSCSGGIEK